MFSQFFGNYLLENQKITAEQFSSCMKYIAENQVKLELIAEHEGLLSREQADDLSSLQKQSDKAFGDLAVEKGYLTESDVNYLLDHQANPYLIFIQALEENNCLNRSEIDDCLASFQKDNDFSDSVMQAIQEGNIEQLLPAFVDTEDTLYLDLIGLALRTIVRFISSYICIGKGSFTNSLPAKYAAYQRIIGDYEGFLGFCCDNDDILTIANGYSRENFDSVDEDALDTVGEFANCINGLYAGELSYSMISIDMEPPELLFDTTISNDNDFYVLPVYMDGRKSNLIIYISSKEE
ncbi:MAG: chemotaxis protein CheX [Lachnospiraceae bacterium]|nr:chemotaxis protein CheX [Lachnospiraceae bacterium]